MWLTNILFRFLWPSWPKSFLQLLYVYFPIASVLTGILSQRPHIVPSVNAQYNYEVFVLNGSPSAEWLLNYVLVSQKDRRRDIVLIDKEILPGVSLFHNQQTPYGRVLVGKLTIPQLVKDFTHILRNSKPICHVHPSPPPLCLSWARLVHSTSYPIYFIFISILSSHLRHGLPDGFLP